MVTPRARRVAVLALIAALGALLALGTFRLGLRRGEAAMLRDERVRVAFPNVAVACGRPDGGEDVPVASTLQLATDAVSRPVPRLNATLHVFGARLLCDGAWMAPWVTSHNHPAPPGAHGRRQLQFAALLEDNAGYVHPDYVQYMPSPRSAALHLELLVTAPALPAAPVALPCRTTINQGINLITCHLPAGVRNGHFVCGDDGDDSSGSSNSSPAAVADVLGDLDAPPMLVDGAHDVYVRVPLVERAHRLRNVTLCVAFARSLPARLLAEFVHYHVLRGVDRFVVYDRNGDALAYLHHLARELAAEDVELEPVLWPGLTVNLDYVRRNRHYYDQIVALSHCHLRSIGRTRWTAQWDLDEFFYASGRRMVAEWLDAFHDSSTVWRPDSFGRDTRVSGVRFSRVEHVQETYDPRRLIATQFSTVLDKMEWPKLAFKPDAVAALDVHYWDQLAPFLPPSGMTDPDDAAVWHFVNLFGARAGPASGRASGAPTEAVRTLPRELPPEELWFVEPLRRRLGAATDVDGRALFEDGVPVP